jgi:hypothetical protein
MINQNTNAKTAIARTSPSNSPATPPTGFISSTEKNTTRPKMPPISEVNALTNDGSLPHRSRTKNSLILEHRG